MHGARSPPGDDLLVGELRRVAGEVAVGIMRMRFASLSDWTTDAPRAFAEVQQMSLAALIAAEELM